MSNSNEYEEKAPFSDPIFNRGSEIVKSNEPNHDNFDYHDEEDNNKKILIPIVSVIVIGIVGYFGVNYLQQDNKKDVEKANIIKEEVKSNNTIGDKAEIDTKVTPTPIVEKSEPDTKPKEIIASVLEKQEPKVVVTPTPVEKVEKVEKEVKEVKDIEKKEPEPKKVVSPTVKNETTSESIEDMQKKVIQTLVEKSKSKEHKKVVKAKSKEIKKAEKPKKPQYRVITVKKGDTLASISKRFYGNPMKFKRIIRANRDIKRASAHLRLGQKIIVPIVTSKKTDKKITKKRRMVTVRKGDTLASIAKRFYGDSSKYKKIVNANYKIKNEHTPLHIGQKIYVPR